MKKFWALIMCAAIAAGLCACGGRTSDDKLIERMEYLANENAVCLEAFCGSGLPCKDVDEANAKVKAENKRIASTGTVWLEVNSEWFSSYGKWKRYIRSIYTAEAAENMLSRKKAGASSAMYGEIDGIFCENFSARPVSSYAAKQMSNLKCEILEKSENVCRFGTKINQKLLTGETAVRDLEMEAVYEKGKWRLSKLYTDSDVLTEFFAQADNTFEASELTKAAPAEFVQRLDYLLTENVNCFQNMFYFNSLPTEKLEEPIDHDVIFIPVKSEKFKTYSKLEKYVRGIYSKKMADKLLIDPCNKYGKPRYFEKDGVLYECRIIPGACYHLDWSNYSFEIKEMTETHCRVFLLLKKWDGGYGDKIKTSPYPFEIELVREGGEWKLCQMYID